MNELMNLVFIMSWVAGVVIAKGPWSTTFAVLIPFWSFYLFVERLMEKTRIV